MATKIPVPKLGQSEETVTIDNWHVKEGDKIKKGDVLFEVETDKAVLEVESQFEGTLLKIVVPAGKPVPVMTTAAFIGEPGEELPALEEIPLPVAKPAPAPKPAAAPAPATASPTSGGIAQKRTESIEPAARTLALSSVAAPPAVYKPKPSPRARKFAADFLIDLDKVPGTGGETGRVTEKDVRDYLNNSGYYDKKITPAALNLARSEKLVLTDLSGSGEGGRITLSDVRDAAAEKPREMTAMRKVIAQRLSMSKQTIPHFYVTVAIDMTDVLALRKKLKQEEINYSVNVFIVKAVAASLKEFPLVNAESDGKVIRRKSKVNIGIAVSIDNGLVVPVVRNADRKALDELQAEIAELAERARAGKLSPEEMKGGTFTISNMGMMNVESFGAIINPGEAAILAVGSTQAAPVVKDGGIVIRDIMKVTLSADHRVVDGSMAAEFVNAIRSKLEDMEFWAREA